MTERDYRKDLEIDPNNLDKEWMNYPRKLMYWLEQEAIAQEEKDQADRNRDVVEAQMDEKIRLKPALYGLEKTTDTSVKAAVKRSKEVEAAEQRYIAATKKARMINAAVKAIEKTGKAMENLVSLWIAGYWSTKDMPRGARDAVDDKRRAEQIRGLNRKRLSKGEDAE